MTNIEPWEVEFDGDVCTECGGVHTVRLDTLWATDDPVIWVSHCVDCDEWFQFAVPAAEAGE